MSPPYEKRSHLHGVWLFPKSRIERGFPTSRCSKTTRASAGGQAWPVGMSSGAPPAARTGLPKLRRLTDNGVAPGYLAPSDW